MKLGAAAILQRMIFLSSTSCSIISAYTMMMMMMMMMIPTITQTTSLLQYYSYYSTVPQLQRHYATSLQQSNRCDISECHSQMNQPHPSSSSSSSSSSSLPSSSMITSRRDVVRSLVLTAGGIAATDTLQQLLDQIPPTNAAIVDSASNNNSNNNDDENTIPVLKTSSGLKYIDIASGTGISPSYGNLCSVSYTAYVKLPNNSKQYSIKPQQYDHCDGYLIKHGNGRMIAGLDEGLHTMKVGGTRRILIPPKLGFVDVGLGPLPDVPWNRYKLNTLLDQMIELSGGTVIYEVTLLSVIPDEADLGYYSDASLSPEDFNTLRNNLQKSGNEGRMKEQMEETAANTIKGQDRLL